MTNQNITLRLQRTIVITNGCEHPSLDSSSLSLRDREESDELAGLESDVLKGVESVILTFFCNT